VKSIVYRERLRLDICGRVVRVYLPRKVSPYTVVARWTSTEGLSISDESFHLTTRQQRWLSDECAKAYVEALS
jgi:hypothetical protein